MRDCTEFEALVSAFIDGDLREEDRGALMEHMASCPACQEYFNDQIAIHDALSGMEESEAPADLAANVMAKLRSGKKPRKKVIPFPQWRRFAALAACCAVVALGVWTMGGGDTLAPVAKTDNAAPAVRAVAEDAAAPQAYADDAGVPMEQALPEAAPEAAAAGPYLEAADEEPAPLPTRGAVSAGGPAARAWVEEELALPWAPGERYELTGEQYAALLAALEEAGELYATPAPGAESQGYWLIMEE